VPTSTPEKRAIGSSRFPELPDWVQRSGTFYFLVLAAVLLALIVGVPLMLKYKRAACTFAKALPSDRACLS
jgi:hypothetical protein